MLPPNYTWITEEQVRKATERVTYWEMYVYNNLTQKGRKKRGWMLVSMLQDLKSGNKKIAINNDQLEKLQ